MTGMSQPPNTRIDPSTIPTQTQMMPALSSRAVLNGPKFLAMFSPFDRNGRAADLSAALAWGVCYGGTPLRGMLPPSMEVMLRPSATYFFFFLVALAAPAMDQGDLAPEQVLEVFV